MEQSRVEIALEKHKAGFNCCQAIACTYCDLVGLEEKDVFRMTEALGLGMAGMMETCGAVSALMILAGAKNSDGNLQQPSTKRQSYALGKSLAERFREQNQSTVCRELKEKQLRSCDGCIADGAKIAEEYLFAEYFNNVCAEK